MKTCKTMDFALKKGFIFYAKHTTLWYVRTHEQEKYIIEYCPFCGEKLRWM